MRSARSERKASKIASLNRVTASGTAARGSLRRFGGITALEFAAEDEGYLSNLGARLKAACRDESPDVLLRPLGNVLYAMPPACTSEAESDLIAARMAQVVASALD